MNKIDINTWTRRNAYERFNGFSDPTVCLCSRLDVTNLVHYCKHTGRSFFIMFTYILTKCANSVSEMRLRILGDDVVLYDSIDSRYIVIAGNGAITANRTKFSSEPDSFYFSASKDIANIKAHETAEDLSADTPDVYYISCVKWIDFTSIHNPYNYDDRQDMSIPRFTFGKYVPEGNKYTMALNISAHHALVDGEPICRTFMCIQKELDAMGVQHSEFCFQRENDNVKGEEK